jgi:hypothetical protein
VVAFGYVYDFYFCWLPIVLHLSQFVEQNLILAAALGVTKFTTIIDMDFVTLSYNA